MPLCNGTDTGCVGSIDNITGRCLIELQPRKAAEVSVRRSSRYFSGTPLDFRLRLKLLRCAARV